MTLMDKTNVDFGCSLLAWLIVKCGSMKDVPIPMAMMDKATSHTTQLDVHSQVVSPYEMIVNVMSTHDMMLVLRDDGLISIGDVPVNLSTPDGLGPLVGMTVSVNYLAIEVHASEYITNALQAEFQKKVMYTNFALDENHLTVLKLLIECGDRRNISRTWFKTIDSIRCMIPGDVMEHREIVDIYRDLGMWGYIRAYPQALADDSIEYFVNPMFTSLISDDDDIVSDPDEPVVDKEVGRIIADYLKSVISREYDHKAVIATTDDPDEAKRIQAWIETLPKYFREVIEVSEFNDVTIGSMTVTMIPRGWVIDDARQAKYDVYRDLLIKELNKGVSVLQRNKWDYVEVSYGDRGQKILRGNCIEPYIVKLMNDFVKAYDNWRKAGSAKVGLDELVDARDQLVGSGFPLTLIPNDAIMAFAKYRK